MKRITRLAAILPIVIAVCVQPIAAADDTAEFIKEVLRGATTNTARASNLYDAAKLTKDAPKIQIALLEKAVEYGMKSIAIPAARKVVSESLAMLTTLAPDRADTWRVTNVELHRRLFRATRKRDEKVKIGEKLVELLVSLGHGYGVGGKWAKAVAAYREAASIAAVLDLSVRSDITRDLRRATHFLGISQKVDRYVRILKEKPDHAATKDLLLKALVVDLDDPGGAVKYLDDDADEMYRTYAPLADKDAAELQPGVCRELGDWYYKMLAPKASLLSKANMLNRAGKYYRQFLTGSTSSSIEGVKVKLTLEKIDKELEKLAKIGQPIHRDRVIFRAKESMSPFKIGKQCRPFPVQKTDDGLGPFSGKGVYFDQKTGKDVIYEIYSSRAIKGVYYKGAAIFSTTIEFLDAKGNRIAGMGPLGGGNKWAEFTLKIPRGSRNHMFLKFHNTASTWFYIDTLKLLR